MEMLDLSAFDALGMKMLEAITRSAYVLIDVAFPLLIAEDAQHILAAKLPKLTVETAPSALGISVESHAQLLHRKLSVRMLFQKINEPPTPIRLINLSHFPYLSRI